MKKKHIHFVGIKGVGMTPLAIIAKERGFVVTGADIPDAFITDAALQKAGITPEKGFAKEHITDTIDLVITTGAHGGFDNIEVQAAKAKNIPVLTQGEAVGAFMQGDILDRTFDGISVAGSHGKTTTTAMLATVLKENRLDPSYVIGTSDIASLDGPGYYGKGDYFVAEADEYATEPVHKRTAKLLWQHPKFAIFTNIEFDHPDLYPTLDSIQDVFLQFANQLPPEGALIAYKDDKIVDAVLKAYNGRKITYGYGPDNDFVLEKVHGSGAKTFFRVQAKQAELELSLNVFGEHNALNATAVLAVGLELGLSLEQIQKGLLAFTGTKRRSEYKGELATGAMLFDDYAHHPTEIEKTLRALKQAYPDKKLICIFQPHTYSRTKSLFQEFTYCFAAADHVILTDIYASLREEPDPSINTATLVTAMEQIGSDVTYLPTLADVVEYIDQKQFDSRFLIVTMGAGDIYKISSELQLQK